ncbi:TatD family hydrolase [Neisseria sp. Ec49-e6-T10]|uniref:TatD family hydrolase n=1 Tax=Neisseria sp. Ec49-e6-T10 TaxID=3140744 RepID=UPI003EB81100
MVFIDSHCHLNFPDLQNNLPEVFKRMKEYQVNLALAISVSKDTFEQVRTLAQTYEHIYASIGVHPDQQDTPEFTFDELVEQSLHEKIVGIGETGLDYHWCTGDLTWQKNRFITHIEAAKQTNLPLIVHTRKAAEDTLAILREHKASKGVIHCFTEDRAFAKAALDLGFYISFSGIVTFKNAQYIQDVARYVPEDRFLIETDAPFLAPTPFRGKTNEPAFVYYVAQYIATLRNTSIEQIGRLSSENFYHLFDKISASQ